MTDQKLYRGKKRRRPPRMTPEERLERQRDRWRLKKARKRKKDADAAWLRTNAGYFLDLSVLHFNRLVEVFVEVGLLNEGTAHSKAHIDAAAVEFFSEASFYPRHISMIEHARTKLPPDTQGTVSVRMTPELADGLIQYEWGRDGQRRYIKPVPGDLDKAHTGVIHCRQQLNSFRASLRSYGKSGRRTLSILKHALQQAEEHWHGLLDASVCRPVALKPPAEFVEPPS